MPKYYFKRLEYLNALIPDRIIDPFKESSENSNAIRRHSPTPKEVLRTHPMP